jgi:hypothetical protein
MRPNRIEHLDNKKGSDDDDDAAAAALYKAKQ